MAFFLAIKISIGIFSAWQLVTGRDLIATIVPIDGGQFKRTDGQLGMSY
jgi:hypothetical protein